MALKPFYTCYGWGLVDGHEDEMHSREKDLTGWCREYRDGYHQGQVDAATERHDRLMDQSSRFHK